MKTEGNNLYKLKKFAEAIEKYEEAMALCPEDPIYVLNKAAACLELKQSEICIELCDKAMDLCQTHHHGFEKKAKVLFRKGNAYAQLKDYDQAIENYKSSLLEHPDFKVKEALRKIEKEKKDTAELAYLDPVKAEEEKEKGNAFYKENQFPESIQAYTEGLRRDPKNAILLCNRGMTYTKLMDLPSALKDIDQCLEIDPSYKKAYGKKGNIHFLMKEYHKALEIFEKGLMLDPTNEECITGKMKTVQMINSGVGEMDQERVSHAMADPEIQQLLKDPRIQQVLKDFNENRNAAEQAMKDPFIMQGIQKLLAAGVLHVK